MGLWFILVRPGRVIGRMGAMVSADRRREMLWRSTVNLPVRQVERAPPVRRQGRPREG
jgi:hypothetical protein